MKITISGTPKEIADLATELQNRHKSDSNRVMLRRKGTLIERVPAEQATSTVKQKGTQNGKAHV